MNRFLVLVCLVFILQGAVGPPPRRDHKEHESNENDENEVNSDHLESLGIDYNRYLKEVVQALESDPEFRKKLEKAEETDIRTGKIASELEFVDHRVRSKLDELKRQELERLRHLAQREYELSNGIDVNKMKIPEHLDHENPHTFEIEDLRKLILKTTNDLAEADARRREEFKEYEMQKEFENNEKMKTMDDSHKKEFEKELKDNETKHKKHAPLHHPGSKQQLEEVWEKQDHMQGQDFNPKVFFNLHDLDGNGYWDPDEVKTLFLKELDKLYEAGAPEDDMRERAEEMERMREHVFREADTNKDGLISYEEFLTQTKQPEFEKDNGWESLDQQQIYTHEEYLEFERKRQEQIQHMIQQGMIPQQPVYQYQGYPQYQHHPNFPQGHPQQMHQQGQHMPQQMHPQAHYPQVDQMQHQGAPQGHPNQFQQHPGAHVPQGHPNQFEQHPAAQLSQGHPNQFQQHPAAQLPPGHPNQFQQPHPAQGQQFQPSQGHLQAQQGGQIPPVHQGVQEHHLPQSGQVPQQHPNAIPPNQLNPGQYAQVHPNQLPSSSNSQPTINDQNLHSNDIHSSNTVNKDTSNQLNQISHNEKQVGSHEIPKH